MTKRGMIFRPIANRPPHSIISDMKAAFLETTGGPEVIRYGELPTPAIGKGEVLIRVAAASLNPIDTYIRSGLVAMPLPKPFIPGCGFAGTVKALGEGVK